MLARVVIHVLARVVTHVLACVLLHVLVPCSTLLARVVIHVLARVIIHVHDYPIFIGPRCPWGPIYGSASLKLRDLVADLTDVTLADEDTNILHNISLKIEDCWSAQDFLSGNLLHVYGEFRQT